MREDENTLKRLQQRRPYLPVDLGEYNKASTRPHLQVQLQLALHMSTAKDTVLYHRLRKTVIRHTWAAVVENSPIIYHSGKRFSDLTGESRGRGVIKRKNALREEGDQKIWRGLGPNCGPTAGMTRVPLQDWG